MPHEKTTNRNTWILGTMSAILTVAGWLAAEQLNDIKKGQDKLETAIMPRQEIEVRLKAIDSQLVDTKAQNQRNANDLIEIRSRLTVIEMQLKQRP